MRLLNIKLFSFARALCLGYLLLIQSSVMEATPTSVFWTNCTTDVLSTGTGNVVNDNYFTVFDRHGSSFPPDIGLELGIFSFKDLQAEAGIDYLGGADNPVYFNVGVSLPEDKLCSKAPSFKVGLFNAGTKYNGKNRTDQNIVDFIFGKTLPDWIGGRLFIGGFTGGRAMGKNRQGFMIAYERSFCPAKYCGDIDYYKWVFCADYASGKNTIGGGGVGLYYYFTPDINIITGPVWFNSKEINGRWKWSVQVNIGFSALDCKKKA